MNREKTSTEKTGERRNDPRSKATVSINVRGVDANTEPFNETCDLIDISQGGISWVMESAVWVDTLLVLDFTYPHPDESQTLLRRKGTARVVRVAEAEDGRYLVAAYFERLSSFPCEDADRMRGQKGETENPQQCAVA